MTLTSQNFAALMAAFAPFEPTPAIAIATSGGPDSMALALLAHAWAKAQGGKAIALTVDHKLREESTREAVQVKSWLEAHGMEHHILTWDRGEKDMPETALQASAREARYHLLGQWCQAHGVKHLLTAHHAQDQLETFLIRLAKGSGLKGLTGIQGAVATAFGRTLRPLLTIDSAHLKVYLEKMNQPYIMDPSNENKDFARIRWRQLTPSLVAEGLTPQSLQETLERLTHSQRLIDQSISRYIQEHVTLSPYGYASLDKEALGESAEVLEEIVKRVLATIGTRDYPVRRQALHRAMEAMQSSQSFTLGGCQLIQKAKQYWIVRELAAVGDDIPINQQGTYLWDNRFTVEVPLDGRGRIAALGEEGISQLSEEQKLPLKDVPHVVLQTLPAMWEGDEVVDPLPPLKFTPHFPL
ncbi:MAG: tRNA lysidine(34) synthetase TilS [Alphaproteobacteria bacterium]|jgi:tRNA(Ile)-lysidine synthase|nr:tRNA lysidine(34) synthetase TilS [Alphaproteobacteria bacterium]